MVDDRDYESLFQFKWHAQKTSYGGYVAVRNIPLGNGKRKIVYMHRQIMDAPVGMEVDHRNHNTLDNRRNELRVCTGSQNQHNTASKTGSSQYKGVCWNKRSGKWVVYIWFDGKQWSLGYFTDEEDAAKAYDKAARELFREFAYCNF